MNHDDEVRLISTFLDHHARHESLKSGDVSTVSIDVYRSPDILAAERDALFRAQPQFVGLSSDLPTSGSFCTRADLLVPTVLTRDEAGLAHAFANVCRHRGAEVARGRGEARLLSCPYHAWTYGLDGALRRIPDQASFPGIDPASCGLKELPLIERHGMLWLLPVLDVGPGRDVDGDGDPLGLGGLDAELAQLSLDTFTWWRTERLELDLNWKLVIETFLEPYHFATLHRTTVGPYFLPNLCAVDAFGDHAREVLPRRSMLELADSPTDTWALLPHAVIVHVLFPGTVLVWLLDHIETWRVTPHRTDPNRCVTELDFYLPRDNTRDNARTPEYWEKNWAQTITTVLTEDFPAMAGVQRGLDSGANTHFTVGRNEPALALFQAAIARRLAWHGNDPKETRCR